MRLITHYYDKKNMIDFDGHLYNTVEFMSGENKRFLWIQIKMDTVTNNKNLSNINEEKFLLNPGSGRF